jgi:hypothetical protein
MNLSIRQLKHSSNINSLLNPFERTVVGFNFFFQFSSRIAEMFLIPRYRRVSNFSFLEPRLSFQNLKTKK